MWAPGMETGESSMKLRPKPRGEEWLWKANLLRIRILLPRPATYYCLLKSPYFSPDRSLLRGSSWLCPFTPLLTVLDATWPLAALVFICSQPPHSKGAKAELPRGCRWKALAPGARGFGWEVLQEDLGKYFAPALSWESGSL